MSREQTMITLPAGINPEWLELAYKELDEDGYCELANFLTPQDLYINSDGKVAYRPIDYTIPQSSVARVLFADEHTEDWDIEYKRNRKIVLIDLEGNRYETLLSLRPTENCDKDKHIIGITLHLTHNVIGF